MEIVIDTANVIKETAGLVDVLGVKDIVQLGVSLTQQGIDAGAKAYAGKAEERKALVEIAEIYASDYRLKLEDAKRWLEEDGLRVEAVVVQPDIAYKDCSDLEVVATNYQLKQKVKPGTRIILKYVTSEVIEACQKLYDESERQKAEVEKQKAEKQAEKAKEKAEQDAKNKQKLDEAVANVRSGFNHAVSSTQKGIEGVFSNFKKKENAKNNSNIDDET